MILSIQECCQAIQSKPIIRVKHSFEWIAHSSQNSKLLTIYFIEFKIELSEEEGEDKNLTETWKYQFNQLSVK